MNSEFNDASALPNQACQSVGCTATRKNAGVGASLSARLYKHCTDTDPYDFKQGKNWTQGYMQCLEDIMNDYFPEIKPVATLSLSPDVVERVAEAIFYSVYGGNPWRKCEFRDLYLEHAKAAIAAMKEGV